MEPGRAYFEVFKEVASEPASRNLFASTSGTWGSEAGVPPVETTPQGINSNTNVCGREGAQKDVRKH